MVAAVAWDTVGLSVLGESQTDSRTLAALVYLVWAAPDYLPWSSMLMERNPYNVSRQVQAQTQYLIVSHSRHEVDFLPLSRSEEVGQTLLVQRGDLLAHRSNSLGGIRSGRLSIA